MRHDEIAADLARKLEKATPGPWKMYDGYGPLLKDGLMRCHYIGNGLLHVIFTQGDSSDLCGKAEDFEATAMLRNAAPLLLSERAALRALEDAARKALEPSGLMETSLSSRNERIERVKAALRTLDAAREDA